MIVVAKLSHQLIAALQMYAMLVITLNRRQREVSTDYKGVEQESIGITPACPAIANERAVSPDEHLTANPEQIKYYLCCWVRWNCQVVASGHAQTTASRRHRRQLTAEQQWNKQHSIRKGTHGGLDRVVRCNFNGKYCKEHRRNRGTIRLHRLIRIQLLGYQ